jgi:tRNA threonylcarbamoyladenosine biosynthesis protein TsaB
MSYILGIDTSSVELSIGLAHNSTPMMGIGRYVRNSHAEIISDCIAFLLSGNKITPEDISHVAIAVGPGSFTGLRIGISYLKGFCFQRHIHVLPISSLECIAAGWHNKTRPVVVACDARNGEVFCACFEPGEQGLLRTHDDELVSHETFAGLIPDNAIVLTDTLGYAKSTAFAFLSERPHVYALEHYPIQRGLACAALGALALNRPEVWTTAAAVSPQYLNVTSMEKKLGNTHHA